MQSRINEDKEMSFSKQPEEDNDLTNLSWLHHVSSILPATTKHDEKLAKTPKTKKPSTQKALKNAAVTTHELEHRHLKLIQDGTYKKNSKGKPPFSYAALICLAMKSYSHGHDKISLSQIIAWIKTHFEYYRLSDPSWQVKLNLVHAFKPSCTVFLPYERRVEIINVNY